MHPPNIKEFKNLFFSCDNMTQRVEQPHEHSVFSEEPGVEMTDLKIWESCGSLNSFRN